jgi:hypothetical protein
MVIGASGSVDNFRLMVESIVNDIAGNQEVADSLKVFTPVGRSLRQVDIRKTADDPEVIFKSFTFWDHRNKLWHVLVEGGLEDYWESQGKQIHAGVN